MNAGDRSRRRFIRQVLTATVGLASSVLQVSRAWARSASRILEKITGRVVGRGDDAYPLWWASMTWYTVKPKRYPDLIVRAASEQDVIEAIRYAREQGLKVSVRSTGHNPARAVLRNGGMLLDLNLLREADIDPDSRSAWIQPGIRADELSLLTTRHGLVFPAAHTGMVGLGGYLLGGGLGWNMPEYGIACRSVLAAEVVTASGEKLLASPATNPDLYWAVRGAGPGFFGAVVRYRLQLFPAHRAIRVSSYVIPVANLDDALSEFGKIGAVSEPRLEILIKIGRFHPVDMPYAERDLVCTVSFFAFADTAEEAAGLMAPVAASRVPELSVLTRENLPLGYEDLYVPPETDHTSPGRTTVENMWTEEPGEGLRRLTAKMLADPPRSPRSFLLCAWSFNSTFEDPSACVRTGARHYMSWYMIAEGEEDVAENYRWMDEAVELTRPLARGHYINEIDTLRYPQHVAECFTPQDWEKLGRLRVKYDPDGVFHGYLGHG